ncbi:universal stress protein [Streptantibioticus ferralitis]|uniref:Universal stress protein n=1 Tax=Streptantibioticus ferralitis TaxID=236510 RepID=A0ABT5Z378_9ACTN|nr:universal stress protein [Streptantibioticus ferralitis]MDF2257490.1 universal stress protein [Streptantibioticus ferralitis]
MSLPLVVGTDGSDAALRAVDWAADEAALRRAPLRIVYASLLAHYEQVVPSVRTARPSGAVFAEHIVASASERCERRHSDVAVSTEILAEDPAEGLLDEGRNALGIVVGSRGRGELAALLLGSVGLSVAAGAQCPVIVVRGDEAKPDNGDRWVALGVGDPGTAAATVDFAFTEAALRGAGLAVVHAWRSPATADTGQLDDARQSAQREAEEWLDDALRDATAKYPEVRVRREVVEGHARKSLLDAARSAELLVVGARRRSGAFGLQLGLVNHAVLHHAPCPVAVVPHE